MIPACAHATHMLAYQRMRTTPLMIAALLLLQGCNLQQRLSSVEDEIEQQYADAQVWEKLPLRTISWNQAVAMMKRHNIEYLRAQQAIDKSERNELSVYTNSIPGVSYYAYINESLKGLTNNLNANDVIQNVNVSFYLPSLTRLPYNVYSAKVTTYANIKAREGVERELISKLYMRQRRLELDERKVALERRMPDDKPDYLFEKEKDKEASKWSEIAKLLGDYSARWVVLSSSIPHFSWSKYRDFTGKLDQLVVCKFAMELEQARLRQYGVALSYLPTINTSIYSPSLFSSSGGTYSGTFLDTDDTKLNLSISYSFDINLRHWNTYRDSKEAYEIQRKDTAQKLVDYKQQLLTLRQSMDEYYAWRSFMRKRMDYLRTAPAANAEEFLNNEKTLLSMEKELLSQEESAIESEAALILQYGLR